LNFNLLDIYILATFFIAGLAHGIVGFSFALIATPILALKLPNQEAILLTIIPTIWANIFTALKIKDALPTLKHYTIFFIFIALGCIIGTYLLFIIPPILFNLFLVTIIWLYLYIDYKKSQIRLNLKSKKWLYFIGLLAGMATGISNIMSPILLIYFLSQKIDNTKIILLSNISFLTAKIVQLIIFSKYNLISKEYFSLTVVILIIISFALTLGKKIREHNFIFSNYKKIVKAFIFIISLILLFKILSSLPSVYSKYS